MSFNQKKRSNKLAVLVFLNVLLLVYSFSGVFSKLASRWPLLSFRFCLFYGLVIVLLFCYAIGWQQVLKWMPLTTAYANKAVTVIWGLVWGVILFGEKLTIGKIVGAGIIILGILIVVKADEV